MSIRSSGKTRRSFKLAWLAATALSTVSLSAPALAQGAQAEAAREYNFNIPAQSLSRSLTTWAQVTGYQMVWPQSEPATVQAPALRGRMSAEEALVRLTAGTGFTYDHGGARTIRLRRLPTQIEDDGSRLLGPVRVEGAQYTTGSFGARTRGDGVAQLGGARGAQDEEVRGYRPRVATAGTGAPTALEDLPRTVTVVTQDQMVAQDIRTMADVLERLPGLTVVDDPGRANDPFQAPSIYVRGFELQQVQVDGGVARDLEIVGPGLLNLNAYERVELVHGSNGVFVGAGSPGGSLNLVRKRPGAAETLEAGGTVGSWGRVSSQIDYSTPSIAGSPFAFRGVASIGSEDAFYDTYEKVDALIYGIVDAPLGDKARLELGAQYGQVEVDGGYSGLRHYVDGPLFDVPSDWNAYPEIGSSDVQTLEVFGRLYMEVLKDLDFELGLSYQDQDLSGVHVSVSDSFLSTGGSFGPGLLYAGRNTGGNVQLGLDMKLAGRAQTFGLTHNFYIAGSINQRDDNIFGYVVGSADIPSIEDYQSPVFTSASPYANGFSKTRSSVTSLVISDVISWRDMIDLTLNLRRDAVELSAYGVAFANATGDYLGIQVDGWNDNLERQDEWVPSWALTYKPLENLSVYFSRASGFTRQDAVYSREGTEPNYTYAPLEPVEYDNLELGVKYSREQWLASVAYYRNTQSNVAEYTGVDACPPGQLGGVFNSPCSRQSDGTYKTTGLDFELAGELRDGLNVVASYNWYDAETTSITGVNTFLPEHGARLLVDWRPSFLPQWAFRGGMVYRSETFLSGTQDFYGPPPDLDYLGSSPFTYTADAYLVADLGATYRFSDALALDIYLENVTDELYYRTVNQTFNVPGSPRSFALTLRWRDLGASPVDGVSPTNGLAPFGDPADWYGAVDLGVQSSRDLVARADGPAQDGVTPVIWTHKLADKQFAATRLGYRLNSALRTELEVVHRAGEFTDIGGGAAAPFGVCRADLANQGVPFDCEQAAGGLSGWSLLFNVIHDFNAEEAKLRPFVGLGVGVTRATVEFDGKMEGIGEDDVPWNTRAFSEGVAAQQVDFVPTLQAQAGLSFRLTDQARIDAAYRYTALDGLVWNTYNMDRPFLIPELISQLTPRLGNFSGDYENHAVTVGLRWAFGAR